MSVALADLAIVALYLAVLVPGAIALARPRTRLFSMAFYALFFIALTVHYFGLPGGGARVALAKVEIGRDQETPDQACDEMIRRAEQTGVIEDRSATMFVSVNRQGWRRLSSEARVALTACLDHVRPEDARSVPIRIVED